MSQSDIEVLEYWFLGVGHIILKEDFSNSKVPPSIKLYWIIHDKVNT